MAENTREQLRLLGQAIEWGKKYPAENLDLHRLEQQRREVKRIKKTLELNCSVAAYGESQVGKSYLMSSLLSSPDSPFEISDGERTYSFIDEINTSGGNLSQTESTGIVTRFTTQRDVQTPKGMVKITLFSVADLLTLLCDTYYNDLKLEAEEDHSGEENLADRIRKELEACMERDKGRQEYLTEDDLFSVYDYIKSELGVKARPVVDSHFAREIGDDIEYVHPEQWSRLFSFLWHDNSSLTRLFDRLIAELRKLRFASVVYVPFRAVLRQYGTVLKVEWLDYIMSEAAKAEGSTDEAMVDVYGPEGLLHKDFRKSSLSALIAELTFALPDDIARERPFLRKLDLLDFPGARSRLQVTDDALRDASGARDVIPQLLRRGKVAYLFNKYSHALLISGVLFCHHNDQRTEPTLGNTITRWIRENIGQTEEERGKYLKTLQGVSPLFFIGTKFNKELVSTKSDILSRKDPEGKEKLAERWKRFDTVIPELIGNARWFDHWIPSDTTRETIPFRSIYLLRDYYWSGHDNIFVGYSDGERKSPETGYAPNEEYPDFMSDVRESFVTNPFVKAHFRDPAAAWDSVATPGHDGSAPIIEDLNTIADHLDAARREKYAQLLLSLKEDTLSLLESHYEAEDLEERNSRIRKVVGSIRKSTLEVGNRPEIFGFSMDRLMIPARLLHRVAYNILILHTETPKDLSGALLLREELGLTGQETREEVKRLLEGYFAGDSEAVLEEYGVTLQDLVSGANGLESTQERLLAARLFEAWKGYLSGQVKEVQDYIRQADVVVTKLIVLAEQKGIKSILEEKIGGYLVSIRDERVLPSFIADYASLFLNHFVTTMGSDFVGKADREQIAAKAATCSIHLQEPQTEEPHSGESPIDDVIRALSIYNDVAHTASGKTAIMKSSFYKQFRIWQSRVIDGLLLTSDASTKDPEANRALGVIIADTRNLM